VSSPPSPPQEAPRSRLATGLLCGLLLVAGCRQDRCTSPDAGEGARPAALAGAAGAPLPEGVVARFGDGRITEAQLAEALRLTAAIARARGAPPPPLEDERLRRGLIFDLVDRQLIREEAQRRGLTVDPAALQRELRLPGGDGSPAWRLLQEDRLLAHALARALLDPLDEQALRRFFTHQEARIELRWVKVPRTPTSGEVDGLLREHPEEVDRYYREHKRDFRTDSRRTVRLFQQAVPPAASAAQQQEIQQQVGALQARVARREITLLSLVPLSTHPSRDQQGLVGPLTRAQLPAAFSVPVGGISRVYQNLEGFYFVEVLAAEESRERPLDDALRREVAARAVVARRENRRAWTLAEEVRQALAGSGRLAPLLQPNGLVLQNTGFFARGSGRSIPGVGLVPESLVERLFTLRPPVAPEPVLEVGADLLVVQLVGRREPDWSRFERERAQLPEAILADQARPALTAWLAGQPARREIQVDMERLALVPSPPEAPLP